MIYLQEKEITRKLENGHIRIIIYKFYKGDRIVYDLDRYLKGFLGFDDKQVEHIKNNKEQYFTILN